MGFFGPSQQDVVDTSKTMTGAVAPNFANTSLSDLLAYIKAGAGSNANQGATDQKMTGSDTGSGEATKAIMENPMFAGLFGHGGVQDQAQGQFGSLAGNIGQDREALMGRDQSYGLTPQDLQAYGQASDQIARNFGEQGNSLAQAMSDRGLGGASSGATQQGFAGLAGNQNEMLAQSQLQIAQNRVNNAQQLAQARMNADLQAQSQNNGMISNLGQLGENAVNQQYGRQLAGAENTYNTQAGAAGLKLGDNVAQQNASNGLTGAYFSQQAPSLGSMLGSMGSSVLGNSGALSGLLGGMSGAGGALGGSGGSGLMSSIGALGTPEATTGSAALTLPALALRQQRGA